MDYTARLLKATDELRRSGFPDAADSIEKGFSLMLVAQKGFAVHGRTEAPIHVAAGLLLLAMQNRGACAANVGRLH